MEQRSRFQPQVERSLRQAGWVPGRAVEEARLRQWYALAWQGSRAYVTIFPAALQVIAEFGGLTVLCDPARPERDCVPFHIDPLRVAAQEDAASWIYYEWKLNDRLFPLGIHCTYLDDTIFVGLRGHVYAQCQVSGVFRLLGASFEQAVASLVLKRPPLRLWDCGGIESANKVASALEALLRE